MWILQILLIILFCHACGWVSARLGQSRVVGEIAAGILLGPSVLGLFRPEWFEALFPAATLRAVFQLGEVGLILLMFQVGLHIKTRGFGDAQGLGAAGSVALAGMALPFAAGMAVAVASHDALAPGTPILPYSLFCGVALSVSAVPVMARIIKDLRIGANAVASLALSAAIVTDVLGWILLAVIVSFAATGSTVPAILRNLGWLALYVTASLLVARFLVCPYLATRLRRGQARRALPVALCYVLVSATATSLLGFHSAFGALLPGLLLRGVPAFRARWDELFEGLVGSFLAPLFFAYAGLHVAISTIDGHAAWFWFAAFLGAGFFGKFGGAYLGARLSGLSARNAAAVGSLMNTRGLMELIVLSIGLDQGILPPPAYAVLVIFALVTTAMTAPMLRLLIGAGAPERRRAGDADADLHHQPRPGETHHAI